ncbi:response regulator transcription factor [Mycoplasmatota bacterium]|nr:response regulator transcription factor [Mycoplasmatota bacterium]
MLKVLIIEDEKPIREIIALEFGNAGFITLEAENGKEGIEMFITESPDLVILDVMLPYFNGWTVLKKIREHSDTLVIMLTALSDEEDELSGFALGVDEYVTKPFSHKVLFERARALLKRSRVLTKENLNFGCISLSKNNRKVKVSNQDISLTPKEFILLEYLMQNNDITLTREQILDTVWGYDFFGDVRVVDTHIKNIRSKLGKNGNYVKTVKGIGYRFEV